MKTIDVISRGGVGTAKPFLATFNADEIVGFWEETYGEPWKSVITFKNGQTIKTDTPVEQIRDQLAGRINASCDEIITELRKVRTEIGNRLDPSYLWRATTDADKKKLEDIYQILWEVTCRLRQMGKKE